MRLIIIDDKKDVLKRLVKLLEELPDDIERIVVHCRNEGGKEDALPDKTVCYTVEKEEKLYELYSEKLEFQEDDHYLLDIILFGEDQISKDFAEYTSVKFADFLEDKSGGKAKIKFYTGYDVISVNDFVNEIPKWGKPLYRPDLSNKDTEEYAKKYLIDSIKEFCNV